MPRRTVHTGIDMGASISDNLFIDFEGNARLASKNQMQNPLLNEFTSTGELKGWTLDRPPEEVGYSAYGAPLGTAPTKQATHDLTTPFHSQNEVFIKGASPPDASHQAAVPPYIYPPQVELIAVSGGVGFLEGWWPLSFRFVNAVGATELGPITVVHLDNGQGLQIGLPDSVPQGTYMVQVGMIGPYATENDALNVPSMYIQTWWFTSPRLPSIGYLLGPYITRYPAYFHINSTYLPPPPPPPPPPPFVPPPEPAPLGEVEVVITNNPGNNKKKKKR